MGPCIVIIFSYTTRRNVTQFILSGNCSIYFGRYHHQSSGAQTIVSTEYGVCHTVMLPAAIVEELELGTGLSLLWVACATHSTLTHTHKHLFVGRCQVAYAT